MLRIHLYQNILLQINNYIFEEVKKMKKRILSIFIVFLISSSAFVVIGIKGNKPLLVDCIVKNNTVKLLEENGIINLLYNSHFNDQELDLLYGEIAFYIMTPPDLNVPFNISFSLPPNYLNQAPIIFEIRNDTTAEILSHQIVKETNSPNIAVKFIIAPDRNDEYPFVHFDFWVLVKNNEFNDLPNYIEIPTENDLPDETKIWLNSTEAVQSDSRLIDLKAKCLKGNNQNLISLADKTVKYTSSFRFRHILWRLVNLIPINSNSGWAKCLDALSSLLFGGTCTGRANLGTALMRANGVPARVLHVMPTPSSLSRPKFLTFSGKDSASPAAPDDPWRSGVRNTL